MKLIERKDYLNQLKAVKNTPDIKVITGIRRGGKSKLMDSYIEYISKSESKANIIHINYSLDINEPLKNKNSLIKYVDSKYRKNKQNYLFIDEVQMCKGFEWAINNFHAQEKYDIYITGSNAFLMNNDLATLFTGRTFEIEVFPFSFKEYIEYHKTKNIYSAFTDYMKYGGMSGSYIYKNEKDKYKYIKNVYTTLIVRDIIKKHKIKNVPLLKKICSYLIDNIGRQSSSRNISNEINKKEDKTTHRTVGKHLSYLCDSFAFYMIKRYDLKGKKYLSTNEKYYLADHSFKYAINGTKNTDYGSIIENIVAIELLRRGYELYSGALYNKEIDFVAINRREKLYIQVSYNIESTETKERELAPLLSVRDNYPKILITRTNGMPSYDIEGIQIVDITEWLLNNE